jgi:hypothetical protein
VLVDLNGGAHISSVAASASHVFAMALPIPGEMHIEVANGIDGNMGTWFLEMRVVWRSRVVDFRSWFVLDLFLLKAQHRITYPVPELKMKASELASYESIWRM